MKKRFIALLLCICMVLSPSPSSVFAVASGESTGEFAGGDGTEANPYLIETKEHLSNVRNHLDAHFKMIADVSFSDSDFSEGGLYYNNGAGWLPIGDERVPFTGFFDGNNHTISGISITSTVEGDMYAGLFGYATGGIKNVNIANSRISINGNSTAQSTTYDYIYVGALVGYGRYATMENCHHSGTVDVICSSTTQKYYIYAGGLAGYANTATSCSNSGQLTTKITSSSEKYILAYLGGIAGLADTVIQCKNTGTITADSARSDSDLRVGGIVGSSKKIELCSNSASISAEGDTWTDIYLGGICGLGGDGFAAKQCYNSGIVNSSSRAYSGGIVGYISGDGSVRDCFNIGHIDVCWCAGIVYEVFGGTVSIYNCYNAGLVRGYDNYAILGPAKEYIIENCYSLEGMAKTKTYTTVCTDEAMSKQDTYVGFDFDAIWSLDTSTDYPWPMLKSVPTHSDMTDISTSTIHFDNEQVQYLTAQPEVTVICNGKVLELGTDYILQFTVGETSWFASAGSYRYMEAIGAAKVKVIGIGNYFNYKDGQFEVVKYDLSNATYPFNLRNFEYDGTEKTQSTIVLRDEKNNVISSEHYDVTYKNNVDVGTATMIITAKGDYYTGTIEKQFQIYPRTIQFIKVSRLPDKLVYKKGESQIDVTGGEITIYYSGGGIETFSITADMLDGNYNLSLPGTQNVRLTYKEHYTYFEITVIDITRGDVNNDGKITITDMLAVKAHILGKSALEGDVATAADTNKDGKITITDFIQIKSHILGKSTIEQ